MKGAKYTKAFKFSIEQLSDTLSLTEWITNRIVLIYGLICDTLLCNACPRSAVDSALDF